MKRKKKKKQLPDATKYKPQYQGFDGYVQVPDDQPGLPGINKLNTATSQGRNRLWGQIHEGDYMRSKSIDQKINDKLQDEISKPYFESQDNAIFSEMISMAGNGFSSPQEFKKFLVEGAILNINKLSSTYIGLPVGEYVVYNITPEQAVLVPMPEKEDVYAESPKSHEVHTQDLLGIWDKTQRTIAEKQEIGGKGRKKAGIQRTRSKYPRNSEVVGAFEASGKSQEDLAASCGVEPPQISRIKNQSGAGARKPSVDLAVCVANQTGQSVEDMFGDVAPRKKSTSTSGRGKGSGSPYQSESIEPNESDAIMEFQNIMSSKPQFVGKNNGWLVFNASPITMVEEAAHMLEKVAANNNACLAIKINGKYAKAIPGSFAKKIISDYGI